ncbi:Hypothetical protein CAP_7432 [Chondromyces apiculatus DSM 436]|uniref:Uncharacterized protein n=1 Tax=Chondromyces apiculatus DSM 436 TaxID=1192034 RepID=A0A017SZC4_9BACT|nr:Hypothetical protein CAP_7432 [Chondromyces apiculatus DSM 436]
MGALAAMMPAAAPEGQRQRLRRITASPPHPRSDASTRHTTHDRMGA